MSNSNFQRMNPDRNCLITRLAIVTPHDLQMFIPGKIRKLKNLSKKIGQCWFQS